jgi:hypothetical protein
VVFLDRYGATDRDFRRLAVKSGLTGLLLPDHWHSIAIRMRGADFWVLLEN